MRNFFKVAEGGDDSHSAWKQAEAPVHRFHELFFFKLLERVHPGGLALRRPQRAGLRPSQVEVGTLPVR